MNNQYIGQRLCLKRNISGDPGILSGNAEEKGADSLGNAILYSSRVPLAAGHSDDVSLTDDPAKGWGWLADKGFDIIPDRLGQSIVWIT
mgnify:CR=1 FL=1